jgi:hypothetical protein
LTCAANIGRLASAMVSASVRKGVLGSCNRAASQAAGRAYLTVHIRAIETTLYGLASGFLKFIANTEPNLAKIP